MSVDVKIRKKLNSFQLDMEFHSTADRIGILGASGGGKSMLLKCIAGIETPDEGRIGIDGTLLFDSRDKVNMKPQKRNVGYLFQNYALFPTMTVERNIAAGLTGTRQQKRERVAEMVKKFRLEGLEKRLPGELSGGQQQRTALARIMAYEPGVLLLDEPFSALDLYLKDRLQRELSEMLEEYEGTVILVSHSRDEIYRFSDETYMIGGGKILAGGKTEKLFEDPGCIEAARLTGCKNFSRAERIGRHCVRITDWEVTVKTEREVPEDITYIGYRAHEFIPVWKGSGEEECEEESLIPFCLESCARLPFEHNYYLKPAGVDPIEERICWFVQKDRMEELEKKGMPDYLRMDEKELLFLR